MPPVFHHTSRSLRPVRVRHRVLNRAARVSGGGAIMEIGPGDIRVSQAGAAVIGLLITALAGTVAKLYYALVAAKDAQYAAVMATKEAQYAEMARNRDRAEEALKRDRDAFYAMSSAAVANLEIAVNQLLKFKGLPPYQDVAGLGSQRGAADPDTLRARLASMSEAAGLPAPPPVSPPGH